MVRAAITPLKKSGVGTIVNISSIAFAATKGARNTMTRSLARIATPGDIADVVAFFAGPESRHITGETLLADGGLHLTAGKQASVRVSYQHISAD